MSRFWLLLSIAVASLFGLAGCTFQNDPAPYVYQCETVEEAAFDYRPGGTVRCAADDPLLEGVEPTLPTDVCVTLVADKSFPDESKLDTARVQAALNQCSGRAVKLVADPENEENNVFLTSHIEVNSVVLWVDENVWLMASRNPDLYQETGNCGKPGLTDSVACLDFIQVRGLRPGIVGRGHIDGQGGEPLVDRDYSWWQLSGALRDINGSIGNPQLIISNVASRGSCSTASICTMPRSFTSRSRPLLPTTTRTTTSSRSATGQARATPSGGSPSSRPGRSTTARAS
jgi:hypothetical protein